MILTLAEAKSYLKIDGTTEDSEIQDLIDAAEEVVKISTGKTFDATNKLAKMVVRILITDWHENRNNVGRTDHIYEFIAGYMAQLSHCTGVVVTTSTEATS